MLKSIPLTMLLFIASTTLASPNPNQEAGGLMGPGASQGHPEFKRDAQGDSTGYGMHGDDAGDHLAPRQNGDPTGTGLHGDDAGEDLARRQNGDPSGPGFHWDGAGEGSGR